MTAYSLSSVEPAPIAQSRTLPTLLSYAAIYIAAGILALSAGFRWFGRGRDFLEYQSYYNAIPERFSTHDTRFEPAFHLMAWSFKSLTGLPYVAFASLIAFVSLSIKFTLIRKHLSLWPLALVAYFCIFYPSHEYTQVRTAIGLAFVYLALHLALEERFLPAAVAGLVGVLFHYSAILPLGVFVAVRFLRGKVAIWTFGIAAVFLALLWQDIDKLSVDLFARVNPFVHIYALNARNLESRPLSVNNILFYAALFSAVALGWFKRGPYVTTFLLMSIASAATLFLFVNSPELAQRTKEVLFLAVIFAVFRRWNRAWDIIPMGFIAADAGLLIYLAFREHVLGA